MKAFCFLLTVLFVLAMTVHAHAEKKLYMSFLTNGPVVALHVARLSDKMVVEKVISQTLPSPGGLTAIHVGDRAGEFYVYYNRQLAGGSVRIFRSTVGTNDLNFSNQSDKPLSIKPNSLLSFDVNDGIGSMQRGSNSIDSFVVNENIPAQFKGLTRSPLPGEPYGVSNVRIVTPSGANEYHGSLFFRQQDSSTGVSFQKKTGQTNQPPKFFRFTGQDLPRNIALITGPLITDRIFFFGAFERVSQGNRQIGHLIRGLDNNSFESLGPLITVDAFRNHGNPNATYFKTADATLETRADGKTSRIYLVSDRFNTGKNANEFYGSIWDYTNSVKRVQPLKRLDLPISNNSVANGVDIQIIDPSERSTCLQDDNSPGNNVAFNTQSGSYEFHCNGNTFSGTATIETNGNMLRVSQNSGESSLSLTINLTTRVGSGSFRSGTTTCTITDRNIDNNICN